MPTQVRQLKPAQVWSYHSPVEVSIAWIPYENRSVVRTSDDEWAVVKSDSAGKGSVPVILIKYPETGDTVYIEMNTRNEMLGQLMKHSLMTQEPIRQPYGEFIKTASCTKCHPSDVPVEFNR